MDESNLATKVAHLCPTCGKNLSSKRNLNLHEKKFRPSSSNEPQYKCNYGSCDKVFTSRKKLNNHLRGHITSIPSYPPVLATTKGHKNRKN